MKRLVKADALRKKLPSGFRLPSAFDAFVHAAASSDPTVGPWFQLVWTHPREFELKKEAARELVPFLRLGDGGIVAFWTGAAGTPIVHLGSEGQRGVVAADFADFLRRLAARRTGLSDLDTVDEPLSLPRFGRSTRKPPALGRLNRAFAAWCEAGSALEQPLASKDAERLRKRVVAIARRMLADGLSRVYRARSSWWSIDFKIARAPDGLRVTYLDYGNWYDVPTKYGLEPLLLELLGLAKHPKLRKYELGISAGIVSLNGDRELVLVPPGS